MSYRSILLKLLIVAFLFVPGQSQAYSYASPTSDRLITERETYLEGVNKGDWSAVDKAFEKFKHEIHELDSGEDVYAGDPGITKAFKDAISKKDAAAAKAVLQRAYVDQIERRLSGAEKNLKNYDTAKDLVAAAHALFMAMAGDLSADKRKAISGDFEKALDAVGRPGLLGFGSRKPDPAAFKKASDAIVSSLKASEPSS